MEVSYYATEIPVFESTNISIIYRDGGFVQPEKCNDDVEMDPILTCMMDNVLIMAHGRHAVALDSTNVKRKSDIVPQVQWKLISPVSVDQTMIGIYPYVIVAKDGGLDLYNIQGYKTVGKAYIPLENENEFLGLHGTVEDTAVILLLKRGDVGRAMRGRYVITDDLKLALVEEAKYIGFSGSHTIKFGEGDMYVDKKKFKFPKFPPDIVADEFDILASHYIPVREEIVLLIWYMEDGCGTTAVLFGKLGDKEFGFYSIQNIDIPLESYAEGGVRVHLTSDCYDNVYLCSNHGPEVTMFMNIDGKWVIIENEVLGVEGVVHMLHVDSFPMLRDAQPRLWVSSQTKLTLFQMNYPHLSGATGLQQLRNTYRTLKPIDTWGRGNGGSGRRDNKNKSTRSQDSAIKADYTVNQVVTKVEAIVNDRLTQWEACVDNIYTPELLRRMETLKNRSKNFMSQMEEEFADMNDEISKPWNRYGCVKTTKVIEQLQNDLIRIKKEAADFGSSDMSVDENRCESARYLVFAQAKLDELNRIYVMVKSWRGNVDFVYTDKRVREIIKKTVKQYHYGSHSLLNNIQSQQPRETSTPIFINVGERKGYKVLLEDINYLCKYVEAILNFDKNEKTRKLEVNQY